MAGTPQKTASYVGISATAEAGTVDSPGTDTTRKPEVIRLADVIGDSGIGNIHKGNITVDQTATSQRQRARGHKLHGY